MEVSRTQRTKNLLAASRLKKVPSSIIAIAEDHLATPATSKFIGMKIQRHLSIIQIEVSKINWPTKW